jgi:hypothetical protein
VTVRRVSTGSASTGPAVCCGVPQAGQNFARSGVRSPHS